MKVTLWGARGAIATPGPETTWYGGNTSCVEIRGSDGTLLVLDAGTGIRRLSATLGPETKRVDVLLTHLHMDHIQGLGFFDPLEEPDMDIHIWGPSSTMQDLRARLNRYLSPPLFPVRLRDLPCSLDLHDVASLKEFQIGAFEIQTRLVMHPGPTVGYRITENGASVTYLPDHEPALGDPDFPGEPDWISGFDLAADADLLIHDCQFSAEEYAEHVGWGHSSVHHALAFARATRVKKLIAFHHDPSHTDDTLDRMFVEARRSSNWPFDLVPAREGDTFDLGV